MRVRSGTACSASHVKDVCCSRGTPASPPQMYDDAAARVWIKRRATVATELSATGGAFAPPPVGPSAGAVSWLGWSVPCAHGLCQSEAQSHAQSAAPPHFATPTRPFSLSRRSKPPPSPRSAAFMAGGALSLARCLLALAASGGGSVVVCRLKANTHTSYLIFWCSEVRYRKNKIFIRAKIIFCGWFVCLGV